MEKECVSSDTSIPHRLDRALAGIGEAGTFFLLVLAAAGCATSGQVREEVDRLDEAEQRLAELQTRLDSITAEIDREESALAARQEELAAAQSQVALASEQARRAQASASGNLAGETVFRIDGVGFEPGTSTLTEGSKLLLDQLVDRLRAENAAYFLEVQSDPGEASSPLGAARVDAVRRYLHAGSWTAASLRRRSHRDVGRGGRPALAPPRSCRSAHAPRRWPARDPGGSRPASALNREDSP